MKTIISRIILIVMLSLSLTLEYIDANTKAHQYEVPAVVDEIVADCVTLVDNNGDAWEFEGDGYEIGQMVIVVFDDCRTANPYDDEIIEIRG